MDKKESFGDFSEKIVLMALFNVPSSVQRVPEIESSLIRKSNCYKQFVKEIAFLRRGYSQRGRSNSLLRNSSITLCFINMLIKGSNKNYVTPSDILPFFRVCVWTSSIETGEWRSRFCLPIVHKNFYMRNNRFFICVIWSRGIVDKANPMIPFEKSQSLSFTYLFVN